MTEIPAPRNWGSCDEEPFLEYRSRWPEAYSRVPDVVIETWVHRHWREFQEWLQLRPLEWRYELRLMTNEQISSIQHVGNWMTTLDAWGEDIFANSMRKATWLGRYLIENGTTPAPIIVAVNAGQYGHPREFGNPRMREPYQLIEGHLRLAYLRALIRRQHDRLRPSHQVVAAVLPRSAQ